MPAASGPASVSRWRGERGDAVLAGLLAAGFRLGQARDGTTITYKVASASASATNGEAQLSSLVAGDAVRYPVNSGTTTIDKLHAGDETKNLPSGSSATTSGYGA